MKRLFIKSLVALAAVATVGMAVAQERTLKFGLVAAENHPAAAGMKKFADAVAAKSGGKMKVQLFFNGALGSDQAVVSALKGGTIDMTVLNSGILASEAKELAIFDFPFLFANEKESDAIVDGPVGRKMHKLLEAKGLIGLSYWELGYRHITNSKRALNKVEDIEGLKLRVIPNPINVAWVKALGANPTPMPFPEVYAGLEQKAIDGQENPVSVIASSKFYEVQKFMALTNHQYNPQSVIFSKKIWDTLTPAERKIIDDSADEATQEQRSKARAAVAANLDLLKKNGMTVTQFAPAEVAKLREKMKPVIAQFSASVGEATVNEMMAELAKLRK
ncbi:MAG: TRAP transporter substrate-binding protein [Polaromonas sp.]|jgi:tripartite ATP-independent transporter DctP family solute receptor|nr:TRAP transporter substrate-binding protein [Polaromonas sp.]MBK7027402.1 TRAP transporter substrate-binding protein [Polaromonas sp.]MBK7503065.1 TRAP transporter substrate-binding protein [Polaromonas sp.]MBL0251382.1 TRAP transporter substrate-binding protein [Polaromonas sp.]